jgi:predicted flap endonuclease-1-like 5' DNA nuclease
VAGLLVFVLLAWFLRAWWVGRQEAGRRSIQPPVAEPDYLRREVSRLRNAEHRLERTVTEKEALISTMITNGRAERDELRAELDRARTELGRLRFEHAETESTGAAALARARAQLADLETELRGAIQRATAAAEEVGIEQARSARAVADAETTKALLATETLDLKRRLAATATTAEQLQREREGALADRARLESELIRREGEVRSQLVAHQAEVAARDAEIGALQAQVARNGLLQRQVEDREVLLRSVAAERDQATATHLATQRDLAAALDQQRREVAARLAIEVALTGRDARIAALEAELARVARERQDLTVDVARSAGLIDTLRTELRERDTRFQTLLNDRRRVVEASLAEIARLREQAGRADQRPNVILGNGHYRDDLKRISGIGPTLEKLLNDHGVTSFRQIALWTEEEIETIAAQLGAFQTRIRRDHWVAQARREHEATYGERLDG